MSQLKVTGYFHFTAAPEDAVSFKIMVPYAAITRTAYGEIKQDPFDLAIRKTCGNTITDIKSDEWMREESLRLEKYNVSTGQWLPFPVTDEVAHVEMFDGLRFRLLKIFPGTEETVQILDEIEVPVIQENPQFFARSETEWTADLRFKNGEYLLLDSVIYVWSYPITGNSVDDPKTDIEENRLTTKWTAYQEWPVLFTKGMIAKHGLFGSAVFNGQYMLSQFGVDSNGDPSNDYRDFGGIDFVPNIMLDFLTGKAFFQEADVAGTIRINGVAGKMQIKYVELIDSDAVYARHEFSDSGSSVVVHGYKIRENTHIVVSHGNKYPEERDPAKSILLPNSPDYIGCQVRIMDTNTPPYTRTGLAYNTIIYGGMYPLLKSGGYVGDINAKGISSIPLIGGSLNLIGMPVYSDGIAIDRKSVV